DCNGDLGAAVARRRRVDRVRRPEAAQLNGIQATSANVSRLTAWTPPSDSVKSRSPATRERRIGASAGLASRATCLIAVLPTRNAIAPVNGPFAIWTGTA